MCSCGCGQVLGTLKLENEVHLGYGFKLQLWNDTDENYLVSADFRNKAIISLPNIKFDKDTVDTVIQVAKPILALLTKAIKK
jgi:hypothetical protein